jgi:cytochrome c-type protein NapC
MLMMLIVGTSAGILLWGGFNTAMEYTNTTEFCLSCHEMTIPLDELKKTIHYSNRAGNTIQCADCHVPSGKTPKDYLRKIYRKIEAANDVWGHLVGRVDTPEKFEANRLAMAKREWARMKAADSKECRNCHSFDKMDQSKQKDRSVVKHEGAIEDGKTCIDCHKGIAHKPVHQLLEQEDDPAAKKES